MHLTLTYFHQIIGPKILLSYPDSISNIVRESILKFFDLELDDAFFEIILINKKQRIINLSFKIKSIWARGGFEIVMLSLVMKTAYKSNLTYDFLKQASQKIMEQEDAYKGFYYNDDFRRGDDIMIEANYEIIKETLLECLDNLIVNLETKDYVW